MCSTMCLYNFNDFINETEQLRRMMVYTGKVMFKYKFWMGNLGRLFDFLC